MRPQTSRLPLFMLLAIFLVVTTLYNLSIPTGEAPDEADHIRFVEIILRTGQLPTIPKDSPRYSYEAEQPPLYYLLQAAWIRLLWPGDSLLPDLKRNPAFSSETNFSFERHTPPNVFLHDYPASHDVPVHIMRLLSTLLGLLTLLFIWWAARIAWPQSQGAALAVVGFAAFLPGFTFTSATVTNDALAAATGALVLLGSIYMLKNGTTLRAVLLLGSAVGLGMLSKRSLGVMLPLLVMIPLLATAPSQKQKLWASGAALLIAILIGMWPLVANLLTYGDPFATAATMAAKQELISPLEGRPGYWLSPAYHLALYNSLWGAFGIRSIDLPNLVYALYYLLWILAIVGLIRRRKDLADIQRSILLVLVVTFLLVNIGVAYQNTQFWAVQGRLLLPGLAALSLLVGQGLTLVAREVIPSVRYKRIALALLLSILLAVNIYALVQFILYVYYT
jgi:4-amino-4-deoxy-L-arabinose transferase-like glycosyltransferase